jgi:hypothetical protein
LYYKAFEEDLYMEMSKSRRLPVIAIAEWLMVLPAAVFLTAAAARLLQPRQFEPARTSWVILEWVSTHISRLGAATIFTGMPGLVVMVGCAKLLQGWREDQALRQDAVLGLTIVRRHFAIGLLTAATLLATAILTLVVAHIVTD